MDKKRLYRIAYRILDASTPLKLDCGELCGKACCKGDAETGMYLFPGEETMFEDTGSFLTFKEVNHNTGSTGNTILAVCRGSCERKSRPFSCRIFPLVPYLDDYKRFSVIIDPRAVSICPIAKHGDFGKLNRLFVRNVRRACRILIRDTDIGNFVEEQSRELDSYTALFRKFLGNNNINQSV